MQNRIACIPECQMSLPQLSKYLRNPRSRHLYRISCLREICVTKGEIRQSHDAALSRISLNVLFQLECYLFRHITNPEKASCIDVYHFEGMISNQGITAGGMRRGKIFGKRLDCFKPVYHGGFCPDISRVEDSTFGSFDEKPVVNVN
jgi:hypothetical protein